jgi:glucose-6-phosphate 1-dehydrogenase
MADKPHGDEADVLAIFGISGDLAKKMTFRALYRLEARGKLECPIVGVAIDDWDDAQLHEHAAEAITKTVSSPDRDVLHRLMGRLSYVQGDYADAETFKRVGEAIEGKRRPVFYLEVPPSLFSTVVGGLAGAGLTEDARVVIEKPFGHDLESARELNAELRKELREEQILRIDHYLGKEPVQNLIYFRFANPLIEAGWDHRHIESVQITLAESFGVAGRGKFYEEAGAIRDVVQNHMLEVIACLAMESPAGSDHEARRDQRGRVLEAVRTLDPSDVVRGQFRGYRSEPGVAASSQVETFAALRFHVDNERWNGVPFYVRVGKRLPVTATEVLVRFKRPPRPVLDETRQSPDCYCRFRLSPEVVVALGAQVKKPGGLMVGESIELVAQHQPPDEMEPYERLLGDAANGDATLFAREDSVEAAWRVVDPVLGNASPLLEYEPDTWGPPEVERTMAPAGGWHNPAAAAGAST